MSRFIDISIPLTREIPVWSGDPHFSLNAISGFNHGDDVQVSAIQMSLHTGTHIDAPQHFLRDGLSVDQIPLNRFSGRCQVIAIQSRDFITVEELPPVTQKIILFKTINSEKIRSGKPIDQRFVALIEPVVHELLKRSVELIGIDYYSIERDGDYPLHRMLLNESVIILEGLDLSDVQPGEYQLICFPLRIQDAEASPVRAVLISDDL